MKAWMLSEIAFIVYQLYVTSWWELVLLTCKTWLYNDWQI